MQPTARTPPDADVETIARYLKASVHELPIDRQDAAFQRLGGVLVEAERTGDAAPVIKFVRGLRLNAALHNNPGFRKALVEADADIKQEMTDAMPVGVFVEHMRARHA